MNLITHLILDMSRDNFCEVQNLVNVARKMANLVKITLNYRFVQQFLKKKIARLWKSTKKNTEYHRGITSLVPVLLLWYDLMQYESVVHIPTTFLVYFPPTVTA
jgi:hypothetical protein